MWEPNEWLLAIFTNNLYFGQKCKNWAKAYLSLAFFEHWNKLLTFIGTRWKNILTGLKNKSITTSPWKENHIQNTFTNATKQNQTEVNYPGHVFATALSVYPKETRQSKLSNVDALQSFEKKSWREIEKVRSVILDNWTIWSGKVYCTKFSWPNFWTRLFVIVVSSICRILLFRNQDVFDARGKGCSTIIFNIEILRNLEMWSFCFIQQDKLLSLYSIS